ncbi:hypothetical protein ABKN59_011049 [Abortiporus biennis]
MPLNSDVMHALPLSRPLPPSIVLCIRVVKHLTTAEGPERLAYSTSRELELQAQTTFTPPSYSKKTNLDQLKHEDVQQHRRHSI